MPSKKFKWVIEFEVDKTWVADGYDPDAIQIQDMILDTLPFAYPDQVKVKLLKRPKDADIAKVQDYRSVKRYRKAKWRGNERI